MTRRPKLPEPFDVIPFHVRDARAAGVTASRLSAHDLHAPFYAVRSTSIPTSVLERASAYLPRMTEHQYFSDITAALLYGVPLPWRIAGSPTLHVTADPPHPKPRSAGIHGHVAGEPHATRKIRNLRVLAPADAWCELARSLGHDDLVVAADHLVRRKRPASTLPELRAAVVRMGARRHVRRLRAALADVRGGTDSPQETRLRLLIVAAGLPEPVVHYEVHDDDGFFVGTPDLAYVAEKIAIEYEGEHHQTDRTTYSEDITRREMFERAGWKVILVTKEHLRDHPQFAVTRIRDALRERAR